MAFTFRLFLIILFFLICYLSLQQELQHVSYFNLAFFLFHITTFPPFFFEKSLLACRRWNVPHLEQFDDISLIWVLLTQLDNNSCGNYFNIFV